MDVGALGPLEVSVSEKRRDVMIYRLLACLALAVLSIVYMVGMHVTCNPPFSIRNDIITLVVINCLFGFLGQILCTKITGNKNSGFSFFMIILIGSLFFVFLISLSQIRPLFVL